MPYDLFISYSRRDNQQGRITQLVERIEVDFAEFAGRSLVPFFDANEIHGMDDWRHSILRGLRESRLLLACLSPAYLRSEYCEWEFNEYLKHEIGCACFGDGVSPIYFVEVPGWTDKDFEQRCAAWVAELRRRQNFDLRPWFQTGAESLRDATVRERMHQLNAQLNERVTRGERAEHSLGNVDAHNPNFIGRTTELRRLRETVALGKVGVLTAVNGLGGVGKTALAIEYAHAFAHEYGGGRWQVRCEGKEDLRSAIAELAAPLALEFNEDEKKDTDRQFQRVLAELRRLADTREPHRCLLLLDNVDAPRLLEPAQTQRLPAADWLHVFATTRLGESDLHGKHKDRAFLPVDELPEADALEVIETYQPNGAFPDDAEREAARGIVNLLGGFTLAVETAAVYLGQFANDVTCAGFLARLERKGLTDLDIAAEQASEGVRHGEKSLTATLTPMFERLTEPEKLALRYAALLPADHIALPWIRALVAEEFPNIGRDAEPGYPDPWINLLRILLGRRLLLATSDRERGGGPLVAKMHRCLQELVATKTTEILPAAGLRLSNVLLARSSESNGNALQHFPQWETDCLSAAAALWLRKGLPFAQLVALNCSSSLVQVGRFHQALDLGASSLKARQGGLGGPSVSETLCLSLLGSINLHLADYLEAERQLVAARELCDGGAEQDLQTASEVANSLACLYRELRRPDDAFPIAEEALRLSERVHGLGAPQTAIRCINLGLVHQDMCRLPEAVAFFRRALEIDRLQFGERHIAVCQDRSTLAEALRNCSEATAAEAILRHGLSEAKACGTDSHPVHASLLTNLARIVEDNGDVAQAREMLKSSLQINLQCYGEGSRRLASCYSNLGVNSLSGHKYDRAISEFEKAILIEESGTAVLPHQLAHRQLNLSVAYLLAGNEQATRRHIQSSWNLGAKFSDMLTARILLTRLAIAFVLREPTALFVGQLITLTLREKLYAPGLNLKWKFADFIRIALSQCPATDRFLWNAIHEHIENRASDGGEHHASLLSSYSGQSLDIAWNC